MQSHVLCLPIQAFTNIIGMRGTDAYTLRQVPLLKLIIVAGYGAQMAEKALTDENLEEEDVCCAAKLLEIILQNCRGRVDECVPGYLALALRRLNTARKKLFQVRP